LGRCLSIYVAALPYRFPHLVYSFETAALPMRAVACRMKIETLLFRIANYATNSTPAEAGKSITKSFRGHRGRHLPNARGYGYGRLALPGVESLRSRSRAPSSVLVHMRGYPEIRWISPISRSMKPRPISRK